MSKNWDEFIYWCSRFYRDLDRFDDIERDYKIDAANKAVEVRRRFERGDESWLEVVRSPLAVNVCDRYSVMEFRRWVERNPTSLAAGLSRLWNEDGSAAERIEGFLKFAPTELTRSKLAEPGLVLHMAMGVEKYPPYRVGKITNAFWLTGFPTFADEGIGAEYGRRYEHVLKFFDRVLSESEQRDLKLRDRLDAQSATWLVTAWEPLPSWGAAEQAEFLTFQKKGHERREPG